MITHEYIFWCFFPLIKSLGFVGALFLNLFSTFFERFSCCCWVFLGFFCLFFFLSFYVCDFVICEKKAPLTWKKLIKDQILFCEMDKKTA